MSAAQVNTLAIVCFLGGAAVQASAGWVSVAICTPVLLGIYLLIDRHRR